MTTRTKRVRAVLALALGLIAAAPYVFRGIVAWQPLIAGPHIRLELDARQDDNVVAFTRAILSAEYVSWTEQSSLYVGGLGNTWRFDLLGEPITLRVACAVALAGIWLLAIGCQALVRKLTRTDSALDTT